jgi:hypothetical protein
MPLIWLRETCKHGKCHWDFTASKYGRQTKKILKGAIRAVRSFTAVLSEL